MWAMCSIVVEKQVGLGFLMFGQMLVHMAPQLMLHPEIWLQKWDCVPFDMWVTAKRFQQFEKHSKSEDT